MDHGKSLRITVEWHDRRMQMDFVRYGPSYRLLLDNGAEVNAKGGHYGNALQAASSNDLAKLLLNLNEAKVNSKGSHYGNALQAASSNGHDRIARLLLDNGAQVNAKGGHYGNALQAASSNGHDKIVGLLLDAGLGRCNCRGWILWQCLTGCIIK